jgi:hypothetical protein
MALKPDRIHIDSRIDHFMNHAAERGGIVSVLTAGSGAAMDQASQAVHYASAPSGAIPVGILMCDVVDIDITRQHINFYQEEVLIGGKVTIWTKGEVTTNHLVSGITVTAGQTAYLGVDGRFTNADAGLNPVVGRFSSRKDENGYARVSVNLPGNRGTTAQV